MNSCSLSFLKKVLFFTVRWKAVAFALIMLKQRKRFRKIFLLLIQNPCKKSCNCATISVSTVSISAWKPCSPSNSCCSFSFSYTNCCSDTECTGSFSASCRIQIRTIYYNENSRQTKCNDESFIYFINLIWNKEALVFRSAYIEKHHPTFKFFQRNLLLHQLKATLASVSIN